MASSCTENNVLLLGINNRFVNTAANKNANYPIPRRRTHIKAQTKPKSSLWPFHAPAQPFFLLDVLLFNLASVKARIETFPLPLDTSPMLIVMVDRRRCLMANFQPAEIPAYQMCTFAFTLQMAIANCRVMGRTEFSWRNGEGRWRSVNWINMSRTEKK